MNTKDVLTQYLLFGIQNYENSAIVMRVKQSCDEITSRFRKTYRTFDFINLLNSNEVMICFLHQLTIEPIQWNAIFSILSAAKLMFDASVNHEQSFRIHEIVDKITCFMISNNIESWIKKSGGWRCLIENKI